MKMQNLNDLYLSELRDIYDGEIQITKALPEMAKAASSDELKAAFLEHLDITQGHIERLEKIFEAMGETPKRKKCKGIAGLIEEGKELMKDKARAEVLDAGLIVAAQKVEHYEMASYGSLRSYASELGETEAAEMLQATLNEEGEADKKLTELAETTINVHAE